MSRMLWLVLIIVVAVLIPVIMGGTEMLQRLRGFSLLLLLGMFGMICVGWVVNAMRLRLLLAEQAARIGRLKTVAVVMAAEFAYCATPGGSGAPLTLLALLGRQGIGAAKTSAVFAMDQLNDLMFFFFALLCILVYALFHNLSQALESMLLASGILMAGALVACAVLARYHRPAIKLNGRFLRLLRIKPATRRRWARKLLHFLDAFADNFRLPRRVLAQVFALTCVHWTLRYSVLYFTLQGLGSEVDWAWSFLIQMLALSAGQFSLLPGGAGAAELASAALLAPMVGKSTAAAAILIWRLVTYYFYLIAGGPVFVALLGKPLLNKLLRARQA